MMYGTMHVNFQECILTCKDFFGSSVEHEVANKTYGINKRNG